MKRRGRPILGFFSGLVFGESLGLVLLFLGVVRLDSILLVILPIAAAVIVVALAVVSPFGGEQESPAPS